MRAIFRRFSFVAIMSSPSAAPTARNNASGSNAISRHRNNHTQLDQ
jgi:hypothetical protein